MKVLKLLLIFITIIFLIGCYNKQEINKIAIVLGVGIDKKEDLYSVTAQVMKPQQENTNGNDLTTWSITSTGDTIGSAINELNNISPRPLYWPHVQIIIFSEAIAKEGVGKIVNWFIRDNYSRSGAYIVVTKESAEDLLNHTIELGNVPSESMASFLDTSDTRNISLVKTKLTKLISLMTTPGIDATLDVLSLKEIRGKVETYQIQGTAILKEDKLVGYLTNESDDAIHMITNTYKRGVITVPCPNENQSHITYRVTDFKNDISFSIVNSIPTFTMNLCIEGNIIDQECVMDLLDGENLKFVENLVSEDVKKMIETVFNKTAELHSDVYGLGQEIRRRSPKYWKKLNEEGQPYLQNIKLNVHVDANIRRTGLILDSTLNKLK